MLCPSCKAEVTAQSLYCPKCGERLSGDGNPGESPQSGSAPQPETAPDDAAQPETAASPASRFREQMGAPAPPGDNDDVERELWQGGYSPKAMFTSWVGGGALTVVFLIALLFAWSVPFLPMIMLALIALMWLWLVGLLVYRRWAISYRLTSQRFIHEYGILSRVTDRIEVIDVDDVQYRQSIIDRLTGVGTITIESGDRTHPKLVLYGIDDAKRVYDLIDAARRNERVRRGIHIATAGKGGM